MVYKNYKCLCIEFSLKYYGSSFPPQKKCNCNFLPIFLICKNHSSACLTICTLSFLRTKVRIARYKLRILTFFRNGEFIYIAKFRFFFPLNSVLTSRNSVFCFCHGIKNTKKLTFYEKSELQETV